MVSIDNQINSELNKADELWNIGQSELKKNKSQAETKMRESLHNLRNAYHLASEEPSISILLHQRGKLIHDLFGCRLRMDNNTYYEDCPVILSHVKLGFSIGGSADSICNICGKDPWDCEHVKGFKYDGVPAQRLSNTCNICLKESCNHRVGEIHNNVEAVHIITNIKLNEVSLVENPANPLALIQMRTIGPEDIRKSLPDSEKELFIPGETVINCHHCIACNG